MLDRNSRVLAIADDMTGALEVGAKLAQLGCSATTSTVPVFGPLQNVLVMDTETRHVRSAKAAARIYTIAQAARALRIEIIYKKTDSTLRGNIGPEVQALASAYPERAIIFVPAYPKLGRTVRRGYLHIDGELVHATSFGKDELNPVGTSYVLDVFGECEVALRLHETLPTGRLEPGRVHVFDSETDAEAGAVVRLALAESPLPLFCGPGSVAGHLATALGCSEATVSVQAVRRGLVVNGSRHEVAREQICNAQRRGWPVVPAEELINHPAGTGWTILAVDGPAAQTGAMVRDVLGRTQVDCLVVFGGDTAYAILEALGKSTVVPMGELFPGIPISSAGEFKLVSKAGGFGPVDLLSKIRDVLSGG